MKKNSEYYCSSQTCLHTFFGEFLNLKMEHERCYKPGTRTITDYIHQQYQDNLIPKIKGNMTVPQWVSPRICWLSSEIRLSMP
jgi:hypothetical protein